MIIQSLCNSCIQAFTLTIEASEIPLLKEIADREGLTCPCPRLCGGTINLVGDPTIREMMKDPRLKAPIALSGKGLYKAVNGMGLPDEITLDPIVVASLLKTSTIDKVELEDRNGSIYLHELHLSNGSVVHLASGMRGAQVLKITKRKQNG